MVYSRDGGRINIKQTSMMQEKNFKVLLVDDEVNTRELYADVFRAAGFVVSEANDGLEALESMSKDQPDLVFTGIIMPRMDGFSLVEAMKRNVATANIPVVFSSHLGRIEDKKQAEALGAKAFFVLGMTTATEVVSEVRTILSGGEYVLAIDPKSFDAQEFAGDFDIHPSFSSEAGTVAFRVRVKDSNKKTFEAEIITA